MDFDRFGRIKPEDTLFLLIDLQEKFTPHIHGFEGVAANCERMARGCAELGVPVIATEQYPEGLGHTLPNVAEQLKDAASFVKNTFSVFEDAAIAAAISKSGRPNLLLAGVEAHVCLLKSALDGLAAGYAVHWLADCVGSRTAQNAEAARLRALQCGAFSSSAEMALFQLMSTSKDPAFRAVSKIVK